MRKRYLWLLVFCAFWLCVGCAPLPTREQHSAVQTTPMSLEDTAMTRLASDTELVKSLTREREIELATPIPGGGATFVARMATARASFTPPPTVTPILGILENGKHTALLSSFVPGGMLATNAWRGRVDGELLLVYVGTLDPFDAMGQPREVPNIGRLVVYRKRQVYETSEETGALIIVGECHGRLLLTTAGSDTLPPQEMTYDLRAYQMSDGHPADCAPTAAGTPTPHTE